MACDTLCHKYSYLLFWASSPYIGIKPYIGAECIYSYHTVALWLSADVLQKHASGGTPLYAGPAADDPWTCFGVRPHSGRYQGPTAAEIQAIDRLMVRTGAPSVREGSWEWYESLAFGCESDVRPTDDRFLRLHTAGYAEKLLSDSTAFQYVVKKKVRYGRALHIFSTKQPFHQQEESKGRSCWIAFEALVVDSDKTKRYAPFHEVRYHPLLAKTGTSTVIQVIPLQRFVERVIFINYGPGYVFHQL